MRHTLTPTIEFLEARYQLAADMPDIGPLPAPATADDGPTPALTAPATDPTTVQDNPNDPIANDVTPIDDELPSDGSPSDLGADGDNEPNPGSPDVGDPTDPPIDEPITDQPEELTPAENVLFYQALVNSTALLSPLNLTDSFGEGLFASNFETPTPLLSTFNNIQSDFRLDSVIDSSPRLSLLFTQRNILDLYLVPSSNPGLFQSDLFAPVGANSSLELSGNAILALYSGSEDLEAKDFIIAELDADDAELAADDTDSGTPVSAVAAQQVFMELEQEVEQGDASSAKEDVPLIKEAAAGAERAVAEVAKYLDALAASVMGEVDAEVREKR